MNKNEFRLKVFSLSERLFPMVSRILGSQRGLTNVGDAEDALQEIMMKLWLKKDQLEHHPNLQGLVFLTARNYCIDLLRKRKIEYSDAPFELELIKSEQSQNQLEWQELHSIIKKFLKNLSFEQREVLIMRDLEGYEFEEIAAALDLKIEYVRVLLSRARKQVGIHLEKNYSYERA
jgi:RNA polymerase sigma-70 factor (ECF subfamily)